MLAAVGVPFASAQAESTVESPIGKNEAVEASESLPIVVVVGKRASLSSAQEIKQEKIEIVDSVVSEDINKLPDANVTDALSRVTGVQVLRDRGEGAGVAIRGLTQVESTLNGREIFTAGVGRVLDFADIPSEMLAGVDVYKTSSAKLLEGGVGGTIDLRTHRPFDFSGKQLSASARSIYGDLVKKNAQQVSVLASNRWQTESHGEFGALVNAAYQKRAWREDQKSTGNPVARTNNIVAGQTVVAPNGTTESSSVGQRERASVDMVLQWRPTSALELYAEGSYVKFKTLQDTYQINIAPSSTASFAAGSAKLFPGTNDLESITWTNAPVSILSFARDTVDETKQAAVGGTWTEKATTVKADISRTESYNNLFYAGTIMSGTAANFTQNVAATSTGVTGTNLLNPANLNYTGLMYRERPYYSDLTAAKLDGEHQFDSGLLDTLSAGLRLARRNANNGSGLIYGDKTLAMPIPAGSSGYTIQNPYGDFFPGYGGIGDYLAGNADYARDAAGMYRDFGVTTPLPTSASPLSLWRISEETQAAYLMGKFNALNRTLDGNAGLRAVRTQELVAGYQSVPTTGAIAPLDLNSSYIDYLPSANMRYLLREGLYLRGAVSKTITRQDFNQLSPSLTLVKNSVNPALNIGNAGNPDLRPIRADNVDLAVERYIDPVTSVYLTGFYKRVDGFVTNVSSPEVHDGATYQVTRPQNSNPANIRGAEVGYQQFYDFLPGWMSGLGLQANYTYVDSDTPNSVLGLNVPLQNLSKHSYNIIGMYETGPLSARIAYNWRDTFLSSVSNIVGVGALPVYTKAYDWLDASLSYKLSQDVSIALEGTNLLRTVRSSYYGVETRPQSSWINDRQFIVSMTLKL
jgi:TonB-dependent receptor